MSQFEYVIVLMSFIVAFGASELLAGWGRQYLIRAEAKPYPLQIAASVLLAAWVALGTVTELALVDSSLHLGQAVRLAAESLLIGWSFTSNATAHWVGLALLAALQVAFVRMVTPDLG